jgi:cell division protein FtsQ
VAKLKGKKKKKRPFLSLFLFFLLLSLLGLAGYYFFSLPIWKIQEVVVTGTNILSAEEIRKLSGIPYGENLFWADFTRAQKNLEKISAIEKFNFYRIPPASVLIKIKERKPIAVVVLENKSAVVDREGYLLNRSPKISLNIPNLEELPVISGISTHELIEEEKINPRVARLLPNLVLELSRPLGSHKIHLELGNFEDLSFLLDDLLRVKIGRDEDLLEKIEVFKGLLKELAGKWGQVEYVDVRFPNNPVVKYR